MNLSAGDLSNLSHELSTLARALADWGTTNPINDPGQQGRLDAFVARLVEDSDNLENDAVTAALATVQASATDLVSATQQAKHALTVIHDVEKALAIAGAAVGLGAALLGGAPTAAAISAAANGIVQAASQPAVAPASGAGAGGTNS